MDPNVEDVLDWIRGNIEQRRKIEEFIRSDDFDRMVERVALIEDEDRDSVRHRLIQDLRSGRVKFDYDGHKFEPQ